MKPEHIPQQLRDRSQWVVWKTVARDGKSTKVPFIPGGGMAKTNDPETWSDFEFCRANVDGYSGLGFVFTDDDPFIGIDLDGCRNPDTGEVSEWAKEIVTRFGSYAEISPSKSGVKIWCAGEWPFTGGQKTLIDLPAVSDKPPGIEVYSRLRYFAVTGQRLRGCHEIQTCQDQVAWLVAKYFTQTSAPTARPALPSGDQVIERARKYLAKLDASVSGQRGHDRCFHAACVLVLGFGLFQDDALALMHEFNQRCEPAWSERELRHKVEQASKVPGERNYLRDKEPDAWQSVSVPRYERLLPAPPAEVQPLEVKTLEGAALEFIESLGSDSSRLHSTGLVELDAALGGGYAPGEMVVVAARPSHGKSMFALQLIYTAAKRTPCLIVSEEMSAVALGKRVVQHATDADEELWLSVRDALRSDVRRHFAGLKPIRLIEHVGSLNRCCDELEKAAESGVQVAAVDYAQLLKVDGKSRYESQSAISEGLKRIVGRTGLTLLALLQMNREVENRGHFLPRISDLKETGQWEQDADVIMFCVWPWKVDSKEPPLKYQVHVMKNRNRSINSRVVNFTFEASRQRLLGIENEPIEFF
jgi:KaiC/GvpD/RAD55 family RecA-like ATPase